MRITPRFLGVMFAAFLAGPLQAAEELPVIDTPAKAAAAQSAAAVQLKKPEEWSNSIGMKFRLIPAGEFVMGKPDRSPDESPHRVRLTQPFYIGRFEVTRAQWEAVTGTKHSDFFPGPDVPINFIAHNHAMHFIALLNKQEKAEYRLPTEAEWEFAARAGAGTDFTTGDSEQDLDKAAWYAGNDNNTLHPVGQKAANGFGVHDMLGNAWEWCEDFYDPNFYAVSPIENPAGPERSTYRYRVLRGGAGFFDAKSCRLTLRNYYQESRTAKHIGFRIVLPIGVKTPGKPTAPKTGKELLR